MDSTRVLCLVALAIGTWLEAGRVSAAVPVAVPENLVLDGVPIPAPELASAVSNYLEFRASNFQDWHPTRRDVLFTTRLGDTPQLHLLRQPGGSRVSLTSLAEPVLAGRFNPADPHQVVFVQDSGGGEFYQFYALDVAQGTTRLLTDGKSRNTNPRWSRRGEWVAYASTRRNGRDTDLYVLDPRRPGSDRCVAELSGSGWAVLDWSPDDRQWLVQAYVSINESYLYLVEVATGAKRLLTPASADGIKVAYSGAQFLGEGTSILAATDRGSEFLRLCRLDFDDGRWSPVGPLVDGDVEAFDLSADGRRVAFFANERGVSRLHVVDVRSGRAPRLPALPAGVATGLKWHANGRELGFSLSSARSPNDVFSVDLRAQALTRWTASETAGLKVGRFPEPEPVRVKAFDGRDLSGILYRPDSRRFPGRRPVLVSLHGGPESQARPIFQTRWNYLLEELGVAILYPNVRGSAGFGKSFLSLDNGRRREDALRDVGSFLDEIGRDRGLDASRVAVYGGSYGGYLVLASLIHHGDRLRCGIDVVGISSFPTFLRNTQDYRRDLRRAEYGDEREPGMAEFLREISPLTQVERIRKPLLVVQGQNDPRVPMSEAEQMVRALRTQGSQVGYLLAKDEGHGFVRKRNVDFMFLAVVDFLRAQLLDSR